MAATKPPPELVSCASLPVHRIPRRNPHARRRVPVCDMRPRQGKILQIPAEWPMARGTCSRNAMGQDRGTG